MWRTFLSSILVPFSLLLFVVIDQVNAIDCGNCVCSKDPATGYQNVDCFGVPFAEIKILFAENSEFRDVNRFRVIPKVGDSSIPPNLLGNNQARIFNLTSCGNNVMQIDPSAFKLSSTTTLEFFIIDCNVGNLTWSFLKDFTIINLLQLKGATNIQSLGTLPSLPSLKRLSITNSKGFGSLIFPGSSLSGLQNLAMMENVELNDGKVESILAALTSANAFEVLVLKNNPFILRIPNTLANLSALNWLDLSLCNIGSIPSDSLTFSTDVKTLDLTKMNLLNISDNSFDNGYYGLAKVFLDSNQLTEFRSTVYKKILTEMQTHAGIPGSVSIRNNPITCDCEIAWLIRDSRDLLPFVSGTCSNGTEFRDLNPSSYELCDLFTTTTATSTTTTPTTITTTPTTITTTPTTTIQTTTTVQPSTTTTDISTSQTYTTTNITITDPTLDVTTESVPSLNEKNYDTLFYILYGILGLLVLILIAGLIYWACNNAAKKRRLAAVTRNIEVASRSSSSVSRRLDFLGSISSDRHLETRSLDLRLSYLRMPELRPPPVNNLGGSVRITTPYRQPPIKNQSAPPPSNRVRGLRRVEF